MQEETLVTFENQFGVRHTVTEAQWIRLKGNPTNPLTLIETKSPNGKKPIREPQKPAEKAKLPQQELHGEEEEPLEAVVEEEPPPVKRKPGRPKGSKSKQRTGLQQKHNFQNPRTRPKRTKKPNVGKKVVPKKIEDELKKAGFEVRT